MPDRDDWDRISPWIFGALLFLLAIAAAFVLFDIRLDGAPEWETSWVGTAGEWATALATGVGLGFWGNQLRLDRKKLEEQSERSDRELARLLSERAQSFQLVTKGELMPDSIGVLVARFPAQLSAKIETVRLFGGVGDKGWSANGLELNGWDVRDSRHGDRRLLCLPADTHGRGQYLQVEWIDGDGIRWRSRSNGEPPVAVDVPERLAAIEKHLRRADTEPA